MKDKLKLIFIPVAFLVTSSIIVYGWFSDRSLIISSDLTFPLQPILYFRDSLLYQWLPNFNGGIPHTVAPSLLFFHGISAAVNIFIHNVIQIQFFHYLFWLVLPIITFFVLTNYLFRKNDRKLLCIFFAELFYSLNLYRVIMFGDAAHMSIYAASPLAMYFFIKALEQTKNYFYYAVLISFISLIASGAGANPPMYAVFLMPLIFFWILIVTESIARKNFISTFLPSLRFLLYFFIISFLVNLYWLLPFVNQYIQTAISGSIKGANLIDWSSGVSGETSIANVIRMQGAWDWYSGFGGDPYVPYANNYHTNIALLLLGYMLPAFAFCSIYFARHRYTIFFLLLTLVGIIFSQGAHSPFGPVYNFMSRYIPLFWMFRSPWYKFSFLAAFGYSYLGALSAVIVYSFLKSRKRFLTKSFLPSIFLISIIGGTLLYGYPLLTGDKFPKAGVYKTLPASHVKIPQYVYASANWINSQSESFRIFFFPNMPAFIYTWNFNGLTDVVFYLYNKAYLFTANQIGTGGNISAIGELNNQVYQNIYNNEFEKALRISGVLGARYLAERNDIRYDFYGSYDSPQFVNSKLSKVTGLQLVKKFGEWNFFRVSDAYYLPLFYVPTYFTYTNSSVSSLGDLLTEGNQSITSASIFSTDQNKNFLVHVKPYINRYAEQARCIVCDPLEFLNIKSKVKFPFVRFLPGSPFYYFITYKDNKMFNQVKSDPYMKANTALMLANKRLAEIKGLVERNNKRNQEAYVIKNIDSYKGYINDLYNAAATLPLPDKNDLYIKILAYLEEQDKFLSDLDTRGTAQDPFNELFNFVGRYINKTKEVVWMSDEEQENKRYITNLEKPGMYHISVNNIPVSPSQVILDAKELKTRDVYLDAGIHSITLMFQLPNLLLANNNMGKEFKVKFGETLQFGIKDFDYRDTYQIKFDYKVNSGGAPNFTIVQDNDKKRGEDKARKLNTKLVDNVKWNTYSYIFNPNLGARNVSLEFYTCCYSKMQNVFEIKNFEIKKVVTPQVILSTSLKTETLQVPKISFQKINPTRFKVSVKNATAPYFLSFSENYDKEWKAFIVKAKDNEKGPVASSYFGDTVQELSSAHNVFFQKDFLAMFFTKSIPDAKHIRINGYANGWFIDQTGDYNIIIQYWPQYLFYIGIFVSLGTALASLAAILLMLIKRGKR